jgi:hypothetical protein
MIEEKRSIEFPTWKAFIFGLSLPVLARILDRWLSEPMAWGLALFALFMLFSWTPPRIRGVSFVKSLLSSVLGALVVYALTKLGI